MTYSLEDIFADQTLVEFKNQSKFRVKETMVSLFQPCVPGTVAFKENNISILLFSLRILKLHIVLFKLEIHNIGWR